MHTEHHKTVCYHALSRLFIVDYQTRAPWKVILNRQNVMPPKASEEEAPVIPAAERGCLQKADATAFVVPYWHVEMSGEEKDPKVNMKVTLMESEINGTTVTYPVLVNTKAVKATEALMYFNPSSKGKASATPSM